MIFKLSIQKPAVQPTALISALLLTMLTVYTKEIQAGPCEQDIDCDGADVCVNGVCRPPAPGTPPAATPAPTPTPAPIPPPTTIPAPAPTHGPTIVITPAPEPATPEPQPEAARPAPATAPAPAVVPAGQCAKDTDCKGTRVCNQGVCEEPASPAPAAAATPEPEAPAPEPEPEPTPETPTDGWALGGAIVGYVGMALVGGLGGAAIGTMDDPVPAIPLGAGALVVGSVMAPITAKAGKSARYAGVRGIPALRILGWVTYGLFVSTGIVELAAGAAKLVPRTWFMATTVGLGAFSMAAFGTDALLSHLQAKRLMSQPAPATEKSDAYRASSVDVAFAAAPTFGADRKVTGATFGVSARF